jgi:hypothetical protein
MHGRFLDSSIMVALAAAAAVILMSVDPMAAEGPAGSATAQAPALKTPWGEPDLQGIWTDRGRLCGGTRS